MPMVLVEASAGGGLSARPATAINRTAQQQRAAILGDILRTQALLSINVS
jgi:hypothetical protein